MRCVFCRIVAGENQAAVVRSGGNTLTIPDRRQPGFPDGAHLLVIPRVHVELVDELTPDLAAAVMQAVVTAARMLRRTFRPDGMSVWQSNGRAAGQEVPHVHMHVLTRNAGDALLRVYPTRPTTPTPSELTALAERIRG